MIDLATVTRLDADAQRRVITAQIRGAVTDDAPDDAEEHDEVEVLQPAGLLARPELTATTEAAVVMRGDEPVVILLIDKGATAQTPEAGEVRLHGVAAASATAVVRIRADGSVEITTTTNKHLTLTANGTGEVRVNGSAVKVAADQDPVDAGTLTFVPGTGGASLTYTPPGGAPSGVTTGTSLVGKIAVAASRRVMTSG